MQTKTIAKSKARNSRIVAKLNFSKSSNRSSKYDKRLQRKQALVVFTEVFCRIWKFDYYSLKPLILPKFVIFCSLDCGSVCVQTHIFFSNYSNLTFAFSFPVFGYALLFANVNLTKDDECYKNLLKHDKHQEVKLIARK